MSPRSSAGTCRPRPDPMTTATPEVSSHVRLPDLVDSLATESGSWVVVERFGEVLCHGTGAAACPAPLAASLVSKKASALRGAVTWTGRRPGLSGSLSGAPVSAVDLGEGGTAWFVGGTLEPSAVAALRQAFQATMSPVSDPAVEGLLHPRGIARPAAVPPARLVVLGGDDNVAALTAAAIRAVAAPTARVHVEDNTVLVAIRPDEGTERLLLAVRRSCPRLRAGTAVTPEHAVDWVATFKLARRALNVALDLEIMLADPEDPAVAAALIVAQAADAAAVLAGQLMPGPVERLEEHDSRHGSHLVDTLEAWCRTGL